MMNPWSLDSSSNTSDFSSLQNATENCTIPTSIAISFPVDESSALQRLAEQLSNLPTAADRPRHLFIHLKQGGSRDIPPGVSSTLVSVLDLCASTLVSLSLVYDVSLIDETLLGNPTRSFPALERLSLAGIQAAHLLSSSSTCYTPVLQVLHLVSYADGPILSTGTLRTIGQIGQIRLGGITAHTPSLEAIRELNALTNTLLLAKLAAPPEIVFEVYSSDLPLEEISLRLQDAIKLIEKRGISAPKMRCVNVEAPLTPEEMKIRWENAISSRPYIFHGLV
ncbi:hypothetical protein DL96DRAFT_342051 [Flagelloscypha sp. PMI_526]|nr:hypothetical protein DL96DRAFT_342051 [Flagelloscypha sp. PMI_526]